MNTEEERPFLKVEVSLDDIASQDWFTEAVENGISMLLCSNEPTLREYVLERRVLPNFTKIRTLVPEYYEQMKLIMKYNGSDLGFDLPEEWGMTMTEINTQNQTEELDLDNMGNLLDCFDGETVEGGVDSENDEGCEGGACKL